MYRFWTADTHFNHANIMLYCDRPYIKKEELNSSGWWISKEAALTAAARMNDRLMHNMNSRITDDDVVICVGDLANVGYANKVPGLRTNPRELLKELNGSWFILKGNHDSNNRVPVMASTMIVNIGPYVAWVQHKPRLMPLPEPNNVDFIICGHVHEKWRCRVVDANPGSSNPKPMIHINVGVDANKMIPLKDTEVIGIYEKFNRSLRAS